MYEKLLEVIKKLNEHKESEIRKALIRHGVEEPTTSALKFRSHVVIQEGVETYCLDGKPILIFQPMRTDQTKNIDGSLVFHLTQEFERL